MKRKKINKLINESGILPDELHIDHSKQWFVDIFRLGMKHGVKEYKKKHTYDLLISDDVATTLNDLMKETIEEPETNKSGGHKDNPEWCKGESKCSLKSKFGNHGCKLPYIKCKYDTRNYE